MNIRSSLLWATAPLAIMIAAPAAAQLKLCNETGGKRAFAIAQQVNGEWQSEGWWNIADGECAVVEGKELTQRYYYYHATLNGKATHGGDYSFCTQKEIFDIKGQGECEARGYKSADFRVIDTGTSAMKFTFTLTAAKPVKSVEAAPKKKAEQAAPKAQVSAPKPGPAAPVVVAGPNFTRDPFTPGSLGEPYTAQGVFQGCDNIDGYDHCAYHADGWKHVAGRGDGTPEHYLDALENVPRGTRLYFVGDMINYGDITVEVAIRQIQPADPSPHDQKILAMQGYWQSTNDSASYFEIIGSERREFYDGNLSSIEYLDWRTGCEHIQEDGQSTYMIATNPEDRETPLCYNVVSVNERELVLSYVGGMGQDLVYSRQK